MPVCFVPSSNRTDAILSATFFPPTEEEAAYIPSPSTFPSFIVCDAGTSPLQGREDLSPPADGNARIIDPTRSTEIAVFTNTPCVSRLRPKHRQPRAFLAEAPLLCASAKNRCGLRVDRLFIPPTFRFLHATFAALRWHGAPFRLHSQTIFTPTFPLYPRHLRLLLRCRVRSHSGVPRNLRLLFRAVDAMPPHSILRSARVVNLRAPPTHIGSCHCHSVRRLLSFIVCDAMPAPGPDARCADALTPLRQSANHYTHSESAYGLGQGQVGLLSAGQAPQQKACRSVPPRHLPFALILM